MWSKQRDCEEWVGSWSLLCKWKFQSLISSHCSAKIFVSCHWKTISTFFMLLWNLERCGLRLWEHLWVISFKNKTKPTAGIWALVWVVVATSGCPQLRALSCLCFAFLADFFVSCPGFTHLITEIGEIWGHIKNYTHVSGLGLGCQKVFCGQISTSGRVISCGDFTLVSVEFRDIALFCQVSVCAGCVSC